MGGADAGGTLRRCVLEHHPVRIFWTRLDEAWRELHRPQAHPPAAVALLGEAVSAAVLLAATLKFQGTLSLQLQGTGLVRLLVAQCTHDFRVRGVAHVRDGKGESGEPDEPGESGEPGELGASPARTGELSRVDASRVTALGRPRDPEHFAALVGPGRLTVTIEAQERAARYQGIVALQGDSFAECLSNYFAASEQLPTRIVLAADGAHAAGVLVQKMPAASDQGEALGARSQRAWEDVQRNLGTLQSGLLGSAGPEQLLQRLCGQHDSRLFSATPVRFACRCSRRRVEGLLDALGAQEVRGILAEQGAVTVTCEFCGRPYRFDAIDVERLLSARAGPEPPVSVN